MFCYTMDFIADKSIACNAPEELFSHVEESLENCIKKGMLLEIQHKSNPDTYWIGTITMVCGHLLRVCYIGSDVEFWCDINKTNVHPLGWCNHFNLNVDSPEGIPSGDNIVKMMTSVVRNGTSLPDLTLLSDGLTPVDRIKPGMKLEIQNKNNPHQFWISTVMENVGGRLLLKYDAPVDTLDKFWLFYTDKRIRSIGFTESKGAPYQLQFPENSKHLTFTESQWESCYKFSLKQSRDKPFPNDLLQGNDNLLPHNFKVGMKLEAINPLNMLHICPATVTKVFSPHFFLVVLDDFLNDQRNDGGHWLCTASHPYIFPVGWAESKQAIFVPPLSWKRDQKFNWLEYLQSNSASSAPADCFKIPNNSINAGFEVGMKLEAVDPLNMFDIQSAHIVKISGHLLQIYLHSSQRSHWFDSGSSNIFPAGWCQSNNFQSGTFNSNTANSKETIKKSVDSGKNCKDDWCDKIYFNYKCYSGPYLSKNKLSQLPKSVGPGPLSLVIKEVLNMIISIAYKPAKLLKDWEQDEKLETGQRLEVLKAKLKSSTYHATVAVVDKRDDVPIFCKEVCARLQACPYLFGTMLAIDQCPEKCLQVDKTKFHNVHNTGEKRGRPKGSVKSAVQKCWNMNKKKKNKKGLHFMTVRALEKRAAAESEKSTRDGIESGNESDHSPSSTPQHSENGTRPNSPDSYSDNALKKQRKKREPKTKFPPLEMKTRGAKLPNFALQIKEGHWNKKDVQTIYSNTCAVPKKHYEDDTDSRDSTNSNSFDMENNDDRDISDVSDSEEPELKKLRVTPQNDPLPTDNKIFQSSINSKQSLPDNPCDWSVNDVYNYLKKYDECKEIAEKLKTEEVDGVAFVFLNFPTMREHLKMKMKPAMCLCKHVANIKWSYLSKFQTKCE